ncbi:hypothetical protein GCM10010193_44940 [Kitasatospora atroaurantiaca]|uniref:Uncharacterized protein n=1 Tax=Kitasatospora atroaurantiaca TaxID=285545 RepID=A0A561EZT2_9ACTN|nr:hypothetical protein [Kitasatospora atroaurantiaca]TWE21124.1 hypothetical protein FB465_6291 [Kitasatospora atroaurantiaca]
MAPVYWAWIISAVLAILLAVALGVKIGRGLLGILIDGRGRYSLTHLQIVLWTLVVLPLVAGIAIGRLVDGVTDALDFTLPAQVLGVLGIAIGSTVTSTVIKNNANVRRSDVVAASSWRLKDPPRLSQVFLVEEGPLADRLIDVAKFQNFLVTVVLLVGYIGTAVSQLRHSADPAAVTSLPDLSATFVTLLGISHAGYLTGKMVPSGEAPAPGLTVAMRNAGNPPDAPRNP